MTKITRLNSSDESGVRFEGVIEGLVNELVVDLSFLCCSWTVGELASRVAMED